METADAVIIGGGLIGTSIAYQLGKRLNKVVLIEKAEIGGQTSGSCDKAIFLQSKKPGFPIKLARASRNMFHHLEEDLGMSFEFNPSGGMIIIESEKYKPFMQDFVANQRKAGMEVEMLDRKQALEQQPYLSPEIEGSTFCSEDAEVNPMRLTQAFAHGAEKENVDVRTYTAVTDIFIDRGQVTGVDTTKGPISTNLVINAAGPFASNIAEMVGVRLPIEPRRGAILITERVEPILNGSMLSSQYIAAKHVVGDHEMPPYGVGLSLGQTESGNILIGGSREFVGFDKTIPMKVVEAIAEHAQKIAPSLGDVKIIRTMAGFRPFTGDGLPIIDETPEVKGFIIAAGHEGDGIALSPITGKLVADLVEGKENVLLHPLKLSRFTD